MALADIPMGQLLPERPQVGGFALMGAQRDAKFYDYTHALTQEQRAKFPDMKLMVLHDNSGPLKAVGVQRFKAYLKHPAHPGALGVVEGISQHRPGTPPTIQIGFANLFTDEHPEFQGYGLGRSMYTALMAHAKHNGMTHVAGGKHSTFAHNAHQKLAAEHGMKYTAKPNIVGQNAGTGEYADTADWDTMPKPMDDRYGSYNYTLKAEVDELTKLNDAMFIPLFKEEGAADPIMARLQHGDIDERTMALKEVGVEPKHLLYAMNHDADSVRMSNTVRTHPLFGADLLKQAPDKWIKKNIVSLTPPEENGYAFGHEALERVFDVYRHMKLKEFSGIDGRKKAYARSRVAENVAGCDDASPLILDGIANLDVSDPDDQPDYYREAISTVAHHPKVSADTIKLLADKYIKSNAIALDTQLSPSEKDAAANQRCMYGDAAYTAVASKLYPKEEVAKLLGEPEKGDGLDFLRSQAAANPNIDGKLLDHVISDYKAKYEATGEYTDRDTLKTILNNPNITTDHIKNVLSSKDVQTAALVVNHPLVQSSPELIKALVDKKGKDWQTMLFSDNINQLLLNAAVDKLKEKWDPVFAKHLLARAKSHDEDYAGLLEDLEDAKRRLANDPENDWYKEQVQLRENNLNEAGTPVLLSADQINDLYKAAPVAQRNALSFGALVNSPPEMLAEKLQKTKDEDEARVLLANKNTPEAAVAKFLKTTPMTDVVEKMMETGHYADDMAKHFKPQYFDAIIGRKDVKGMLPNLVRESRLSAQQISALLPIAWKSGDEENLSKLLSKDWHKPVDSTHADWILSQKPDRTINGAKYADVISTMVGDDARNSDVDKNIGDEDYTNDDADDIRKVGTDGSKLLNETQLSRILNETVPMLHNQGRIGAQWAAGRRFIDNIVNGAITHINAPSDAVLAASHGKFGPAGVTASLTHPKLPPARLEEIASDPQLTPDSAKALLRNPSTQEHHVRALLKAHPEILDTNENVKVPGSNEPPEEDRSWQSVREQLIKHPAVPREFLESEYDRLDLKNEKLKHSGEALQTGDDENEDESYYEDGSAKKNGRETEYKVQLLQALEKHHPNIIYKNNNVHVKPGTQKLRVIRDQILDQGKTMVPAAELPPGNWDRFRVITGDPKQDRLKMISADKIQQAIESSGAIPFHYSLHSYSYPAQRHIEASQTVFQLNLNQDMLQKIKERGLEPTWRKVQGYIKNQGIHPIAHNSIGWVRFTGDPKSKSVHVDEVQSDHRATMVSREVNDKRRDLLGDRKWRELKPEEQASINARLEATRAKYNKKYPENEQKEIMKIITGGADIHEVITEAFHKWLHENYGRVKIHFPGREFRSTLSGLTGYEDEGTGVAKGKERHLNYLDEHIANLAGAKEAHFRASQNPAPDQQKDPKAFDRYNAQLAQLKANVDKHQEAFDTFVTKHKVRKEIHDREPPAHYDDTYEKMPKRTGMAVNAAKYGDEPTETNMDDYGGMQMHVSEARKKEEDFEYEDLRKSIGSIPEGHVITRGRRHSTIDMSHVLSEDNRKKGYAIHVTTGFDRGGHYVTADIHHNGKYVGTAEGFVHPEYYKAGEMKPYRDLRIESTGVNDEHRGKGLGPSAYEAIMAVAKHGYNVTHVTGEAHSSGAAKVHMKLAEKHKLDYKPQPNVPSVKYPDMQTWAASPQGDHDAAFGKYKYMVKAENIFRGKPVPDAQKRDPVGRGEKWVAPHGYVDYNYSHMVPKPYRLKITHAPRGKQSAKREMWPQLEATLTYQGEPAGEVSAHHLINDNAIKVDMSDLKPAHQGQGLGQKMYEALYAHAVNAMGVKHVIGGAHSDDAHHMHAALAAKHGLSYKAHPNLVGGPGEVPADLGEVQDPYPTQSRWERAAGKYMNGRWGRYKYTIDR